MLVTNLAGYRVALVCAECAPRLAGRSAAALLAPKSLVSWLAAKRYPPRPQTPGAARRRNGIACGHQATGKNRPFSTANRCWKSAPLIQGVPGSFPPKSADSSAYGDIVFYRLPRWQLEARSDALLRQSWREPNMSGQRRGNAAENQS